MKYYWCFLQATLSYIISFKSNRISQQQLASYITQDITILAEVLHRFNFDWKVYNNFKCFTMNKTNNLLQMKSSTGFVLIKGQSKNEIPTKWEWLTQRHHYPREHTLQQSEHPRLSYSEKKRVLSGLEPKLRTSSSFKIREGFTLKQKARIVSTASSATLRSQKKLQPFVYLNSREEQADIPAFNFGVDQQELIKKMSEANYKNNRILALVSVRRLGLRYKLNHTFIQKCGKCTSTHKHDLKDFSDQLKCKMKEFGNNVRQLYYYSSKGIPINAYEDIGKENVLIVDSHPKWNFSEDINWRVLDLVRKISQIISKLQTLVTKDTKQQQSQQKPRESSKQQVYDHQRIKNVRDYAQKLSQNPYFKMPQPQEKKNQLQSWYEQKYINEESPNKESDKNLLFQSKSHYPQEVINRKMLSLANQKVQKLAMTNNRHKFIPQRIDLMMQQIRRQQLDKKQITTKTSTIQAPPVTKRDMLARLDRKNSLLSTQNIPYLIEKYGLNRFQIYNLYNLFKSFEKIAIMRSPNYQNMQQVINKGIDRQTFEVGLKGLDMNPGDELIKNICHFGDFISWEQFIKIISISLRKTPEEKLSAILKGISSFDDGYLSKHQISLMIGNSLHKLFDHDQPELKQYFTNMAMSEFDPHNTGKVEVQLLKTKVLNKGSQNLNMVSFLILNT